MPAEKRHRDKNQTISSFLGKHTGECLRFHTCGLRIDFILTCLLYTIERLMSTEIARKIEIFLRFKQNYIF